MYKELVDRLRTDSLYKDKATLEIMDLCMDAAEAIERLLSELERVKRERDAAMDDLRKYGQCGACKNHYRAEPCGADLYSYCDGGFEWRGATDICEREDRRKLAPCDVCRIGK